MPIVLELSPAQQAVFAEIADELQHNDLEASRLARAALL